MARVTKDGRRTAGQTIAYLTDAVKLGSLDQIRLQEPPVLWAGLESAIPSARPDYSTRHLIGRHLVVINRRRPSPCPRTKRKAPNLGGRLARQFQSKRDTDSRRIGAATARLHQGTA